LSVAGSTTTTSGRRVYDASLLRNTTLNTRTELCRRQSTTSGNHFGSAQKTG